MKYLKFEEVPVWKQARLFVKEVYRLCNPTSFRGDYDLMRQIRRASSSVLLNISEGFERKSNKDFARFINLSRASSGEVRCALYIANDTSLLTPQAFNQLFRSAISISRQLAKFEHYLIETAHKK